MADEPAFKPGDRVEMTEAALEARYHWYYGSNTGTVVNVYRVAGECSLDVRLDGQNSSSFWWSKWWRKVSAGPWSPGWLEERAMKALIIKE